MSARKLLPFACVAALVSSGGPGAISVPVMRHVIVVTLDTTRADRLPAYGFGNVETPALDRIAREGVVFEQAATSAPLTLPAHCTLFTGLLPLHHEVRDNADRPLAESRTTLAEVLHARGMRTAAFVGSIVLARGRGLLQGFDTYSEPARRNGADWRRRRASEVMDDALAWLEANGSARTFAWVHLYDAHAPYALPEPYRTKYGDAPYLGTLAFMDSQVARLIRSLERRHELERTLIVVASDHGESFGEHGEDSHGMFVYQSTLRVALIIRVSGLAPKRVSDVARLADVMPTILDALRIDAPPTDGVSLVPLMTGRARHFDLEAYSESAYPRRFGCSELQALRAGRFKFVSAPRPELYDLEVDPDEQHNLVDERAVLAARMAARAAAFAGQSPRVFAESDIDAQAARELAALGYVGNAVAGSTQADSAPLNAIDPKDCIGRFNEIVRAVRSPGPFPLDRP